MPGDFSGKSLLYIGKTEPLSTARHRADALRRLGLKVTHINPFEALSCRIPMILDRLHYRTGYRLMQARMQDWLAAKLERVSRFDIAWVDGGELLGKHALQMLRPQCNSIVLFNHDDPTGPRDGQRFATMRASISEYDLCVVVRQPNIDEFMALGAKKVLRTFMACDEVAHQPLNAGETVLPQYQSDVAFVGTHIPGEARDKFIASLIELGIDIALWGNRWERSPLWPSLKCHWRGPALSGRDYVYAMSGAKVSLGLLSKGNRDQHTTRSMEIPYAGGLLCAERTEEHRLLFDEGVEAVFWSSAQECAHKCCELLADPARREAIRLGGMARIRSNCVSNEHLCAKALTELLKLSAAGH